MYRGWVAWVYQITTQSESIMFHRTMRDDRYEPSLTDLLLRHQTNQSWFTSSLSSSGWPTPDTLTLTPTLSLMPYVMPWPAKHGIGISLTSSECKETLNDFLLYNSLSI